MTTSAAAWAGMTAEERTDVIAEGRKTGVPYRILAVRHSTTQAIIGAFAYKLDKKERDIARMEKHRRPTMRLVPDRAGLPLEDLSACACHWPLWPNSGPAVHSDLLFCAAPALPDRNYCAKHHAVAHTEPSNVPSRYRMRNLMPGKAA